MPEQIDPVARAAIERLDRAHKLHAAATGFYDETVMDAAKLLAALGSARASAPDKKPELEPETKPGADGPQYDRDGRLVYALDPVFGAGGKYEYLGEVPGGFLQEAELGSWEPDWGGNEWLGSTIDEFPKRLCGRDRASPRIVVFNNASSAWGERGPMRAQRETNATGHVHDLIYVRPGDWTKGRDGHGFYWNVYRSAKFNRVTVFQGGANAGQFVWRDGADGSHVETHIPWEEARNWEHTVEMTDWHSIYCGQISEGSMAHASYAGLAWYNPGQSLILERPIVRGKHPRRVHKDRTFESAGGIFIGPGQTRGRRCPLHESTEADIELHLSRRECYVLWAVDKGILRRPRIVNHGGVPVIKIVASGPEACGPIEIVEPVEDVVVHLTADHPHKPPMEEVLVTAGSTYKFEGGLAA